MIGRTQLNRHICDEQDPHLGSGGEVADQTAVSLGRMDSLVIYNPLQLTAGNEIYNGTEWFGC